MTRPGSEYAGRIEAAVLAALEAHGPHPISQKALVMSVRLECGLDHCTDTTLARRAKEAVGRLCSRGVPVVSCSSGGNAGYRLARTAEDRAEGRRYLVAQLAGIGRRLRALDATAADRVSQLAMDLGEP